MAALPDNIQRLVACNCMDIGNTVLDRREGNKLFQLISDFYQQTSLVVISNKGFDDWEQTLGDNVVTAAVMDRLLHKCELFNIELFTIPTRSRFTARRNRGSAAP